MPNCTPFVTANILQIQKYVLKMQANTVHHRLVKDYELDYQISGNRKIKINDTGFNVSTGSMIFRRPGDYVTSCGDYNTYQLSLDFSGKIRQKPNLYNRHMKELSIQEKSKNPLLDIIPAHFIPAHSSDYMRIFETLHIVSQQNDSESECNTLLNELFGLLIVDTLQKCEVQKVYKNKIATEARDYISENYNKELTLANLASHFSISQSHFSRLFKQETNSTPMEYIIQIRLSNAQKLLRESNLKISYIATHCGFNDVSYFSYIFKKRFGISPASYRNLKDI